MAPYHNQLRPPLRFRDARTLSSRRFRREDPGSIWDSRYNRAGLQYPGACLAPVRVPPGWRFGYGKVIGAGAFIRYTATGALGTSLPLFNKSRPSETVQRSSMRTGVRRSRAVIDNHKGRDPAASPLVPHQGHSRSPGLYQCASIYERRPV